VLYYAGLLFMVELDQRALGVKETEKEGFAESAGVLFRRYWFHLTSLDSIVAFLLMGYSATLSVVYAAAVAALLSYLRRECAMTPRKAIAALEGGSVQVLNVAATCACAGVIVGVVTLTGLGLKFSEIAIRYAGGSLALTAVYTGLIVWVIGLAVPVTASYIISAVIAAPALIKLGVPDFAAHMFIFYYAVLSEVSPPTALSPFAAAAITGGDPYKTTLQSWKYTLPAFVVPFVFVLSPEGIGLLLKTPPEGTWLGVAWIAATALVGIAALAFGVQGWLAGRLSAIERAILVLAGLALVYPAPWSDAAGIAGVAAVAVVRFVLRRRAATSTGTST
jgi:TRAP transporter 4TM/12TM fusion protein